MLSMWRRKEEEEECGEGRGDAKTAELGRAHVTDNDQDLLTML